MTDAEQDLARLKNKPETEKELGIQQVPFRIHRNDYKVLRKLLGEDGWKFQALMAACVDAYIHRNPLIIKLLADWKELNAIPRKNRDKYSLSNREKRDLLDELEELPDPTE
jgi:hypothetical protein